MNCYTIGSDQQNVTVHLTGEVTIEAAQALHHDLLVVLGPETRLLIECATLTRLDAAIMQILIAAAQVAATAEMTASAPAWQQAFLRFAVDDPFTSAPSCHA